LLGRYTRDELTKMALNLLLTQPRLLRFAKHIVLPKSNRNRGTMPPPLNDRVATTALQPAVAPLRFEEK